MTLDFRPLDPEGGRAGYWKQFQRRVVDAAVAELRRRRALAQPTVTGLVLKWGRMLVPAAMAAAALAGLLMMTDTATSPSDPLVLGEALPGELFGDPMAAVVTAEGAPDVEDMMLALEQRRP